MSAEAINYEELIVNLMIKFARRKRLADEEMGILEEWWERSPENRELMEQFGDPEWVRAQVAGMKPAKMREMWQELNGYLDEQGAPDDRKVREWYDDQNPMPLKVRLRVWYGRLVCGLRFRKREDVFPL